MLNTAIENSISIAEHLQVEINIVFFIYNIRWRERIYIRQEGWQLSYKGNIFHLFWEDMVLRRFQPCFLAGQPWAVSLKTACHTSPWYHITMRYVICFIMHLAISSEASNILHKILKKCS